MTKLTRRGTLLGASAAVAASRRARAAAPIRLGVLTDMSGPYSEDAGTGSVVAANLATEDFARDHPELKVEMLTADAGTKTDTYVSLAGAWFDRKGADAIFDVPFSAGALALRTVAEQRNKVLMLTGPATSDLIGRACGPNHVHWVYDSWSFASSTARATVQRGGDTWFFIQADYAMGASLTTDAQAMVERLGAKVLGLTNAGADAGNTIKQAAEFGLSSHGMIIAATLLHIPQVRAIGLPSAQGLVLTDCYYWDRNDESRAFAKRFAPRIKGFMPASTQAGVYSTVIHYLKTALDMGADGEGRRAGHGRTDETDPDQRPDLRQGARPPGRPQDPRHVPVRGEGFVGVELPLGLLPPARRQAGGTSLPAQGGRWLRTGQVMGARS